MWTRSLLWPLPLRRARLFSPHAPAADSPAPSLRCPQAAHPVNRKSTCPKRSAPASILDSHRGCASATLPCIRPVETRPSRRSRSLSPISEPATSRFSTASISRRRPSQRISMVPTATSKIIIGICTLQITKASPSPSTTRLTAKRSRNPAALRFDRRQRRQARQRLRCRLWRR